MHKIALFIYKCIAKFIRVCRRIFIEPIIKSAFEHCGKHVRVQSGFKVSGIENISIGNFVSLGDDLRILTTKAKVIMGNYIMFGPNVTIVTGNHRTDILGKYMYEISDKEKRAEDDQDVVIEDDVWIGSNAVILKGVTIGKGSVVAAGSVVTKSCEPYSVIGGVPAKKIGARFEEEVIIQHERLLSER